MESAVTTKPDGVRDKEWEIFKKEIDGFRVRSIKSSSDVVSVVEETEVVVDPEVTVPAAAEMSEGVAYIYGAYENGQPVAKAALNACGIASVVPISREVSI